MDKETIKTLIRPLPASIWATDATLNRVESMLDTFREDYGLDLEPDFQRGHVWNDAQRQRFIEGIFRGTVPQSLQTITLNGAEWEIPTPCELPRAIQIVDGLQRLTAVRKFMAGEIKPFDLTIEQLSEAGFSPARVGYRLRFQVFAFRTRRELLQYYLDINAGGVVHSQSEIERVKALLESAEAGS